MKTVIQEVVYLVAAIKNCHKKASTEWVGSFADFFQHSFCVGNDLSIAKFIVHLYKN